MGTVYQASLSTLLLRFPEHKWGAKKVFPVKLIEQGNMYELKEIRMTRIYDGEGVDYWSPILEWKIGCNLDWFPRTFALGRLDSEQEARVFCGGTRLAPWNSCR